MTNFRDHFAPQASAYAAYRPSYPKAFIAHLASLAPAHALAWDVGTGSGQAAILLAEHFDHVHATDASDRQVQFASAHPRVEYRVAKAEHSGLSDASVDLVAIGQALHWFATDEFYREVDRVLKRGGILAAWSYHMLRADASANAVIDWFYAERVGSYWPPERTHVEQYYRDLPFPYADIDIGEWRIEDRFTREQVIGYVSTWSAVRHARDAEGSDPMEEFRARLSEVWPADEVREVWWTLFARVGRKA